MFLTKQCDFNNYRRKNEKKKRDTVGRLKIENSHCFFFVLYTIISSNLTN